MNDARVGGKVVGLAYLNVDLIADLAESYDLTLEILGKKLTWNKLSKRIYPLYVGWCG